MAEINYDNSEIIVTEVFSFTGDVLPTLNDIKSNLAFDLEEGRVFGNLATRIEGFLHHDITKDDEIAILYIIKSNFEQESIYNMQSSIFNESNIYNSLVEWIEREFDFNYDNI